MSVISRKALREIAVVLGRHGISFEEAGHTGGNQRKLRITDGVKSAFIFISGTPSGMCYLNIAKDARRALREAP